MVTDRLRRTGWVATVCLACALAWGPDASATVIILQPSPGNYESVAIDTTQNVQLRQHDTNLTHQWSVGTDLFKEVALLQFDLSSVPVGQHIDSAELTLYQSFNSAPGAIFDIFQNTSSWSSGSVTWSTKPSVGSAPLSSVTLTADAGKYYSFDVTAALDSWMNAPATNFGFSFERPNQANPIAEFASGLASASNPQANWPMLTITLSAVPEPSSLLLVAAGGAGLIAFARRRMRK